MRGQDTGQHPNGRSGISGIQIAADAAKLVIDGGVFQLHPSYSQLFSYAGEANKEVIFEIGRAHV